MSAGLRPRASADRVGPARRTWRDVVSDFWNNQIWRHKDVVWAIFETILMAFLGTVGRGAGRAAAGLPRGAQLRAARASASASRRVFDFLRGVDGLIWTIVLSRAFGPGPMTGALAILLTDTGTFGKLFSEALENVDDEADRRHALHRRRTRSSATVSA